MTKPDQHCLSPEAANKLYAERWALDPPRKNKLRDYTPIILQMQAGGKSLRQIADFLVKGVGFATCSPQTVANLINNQKRWAYSKVAITMDTTPKMEPTHNIIPDLVEPTRSASETFEQEHNRNREEERRMVLERQQKYERLKTDRQETPKRAH
jgi:hypothetical protein